MRRAIERSSRARSARYSFEQRMSMTVPMASRYDRDDRPAEDVGARADLEQPLKRGRAADEAPCAENALESEPTTNALS